MQTRSIQMANFSFFVAICLYGISLTLAEDIGFIAVRGKRSVQNENFDSTKESLVSNDIINDNERLIPDLLRDLTESSAYKRAPVGFVGMRGKKEFEYSDMDYPNQMYRLAMDASPKRVPSGFMGMRGKKSTDASTNKRVPSGFQGMRGKKDIENQEQYSDSGETQMDNLNDLVPLYDVDNLGYDNWIGNNDEKTGANSIYFGIRGKREGPPKGFVGMRGKRGPPTGFVGMRGKRGPPTGFVGMRGKRAPPTGFMGMRGKRAPPTGFMGMRGKRAGPPIGFVGMRGKRAPTGFFGMRGKKDIPEQELFEDKRSLGHYFGIRGKKQPLHSGFFGMRGKKQPFEFRGKFVGVRGKKSSEGSLRQLEEELNEISNDEISNFNLMDRIIEQEKRVPSGFMGMRGKKVPDLPNYIE